MVAHTPKWGLSVEEPGDPSDMPAASGRSAASMEAALDRVVTQYTNADQQKVNKAGDTMTGPLTVQGRIASGYDLMTGAWSWLAESGELRLVRWSPNLTLVESMPIVLNYATGAIRFAHPVTMAGIAYMPPSTPGEWTHVRCGPDGTLYKWTQTYWEAAVRIAAGSSDARSKNDIGDGPAPDLSAAQPRVFTWAEGNPDRPGQRYGFVAQELAEVDARLVTVDGDGEPNGIDTGAVLAALVSEVQDLRRRISALEGGAS